MVYFGLISEVLLFKIMFISDFKDDSSNSIRVIRRLIFLGPNKF